VPLDPVAALTAPGLPAVCQRVAGLAHSHFRAAAQAMRQCDAKAMKPARLMGATYAAILSRVERRGWSPPSSERISLPTWQKLWLVLRYGLA
jgi:phytoene synthase